jgi:dTDP-4-dehydrorhamnose reductase
MKIAVTGALGQLGGELCRQIGPTVIPLDIDTLDLTDSDAVFNRLMALRPESIINCAAYTQVDKAEKEPELAQAVNATAVENLVCVSRELDCPLVQISTDYVFGLVYEGLGARGEGSGASDEIGSMNVDNKLKRPHCENDPVSPQGVYARTKLEGEVVASRFEKHIIVRTCGLYARPTDERANNFVKTMLRLATSRNELRVVADQHCTPSYVPHVARAILFLAGFQQPSAAPCGLYHVTNAGATTWYDFAVEIFRQAEINISVKPITSVEYAAPAARPAYSVLDTAKYHRLGGPPMPDWKTALVEYFEEWKKM